MRVAVSGSHGTGKSTLIAAFLARRPEYLHEPEAYEELADEVRLGDEGPDAEGLESMLRLAVAAVDRHAGTPDVVFERSPVDYLAYAASTREWDSGSAGDFIAACVPVVRQSVRKLDLIVLLPVGTGVGGRSGEDPRFRRRVDGRLRRALIDDDYRLFGEDAPSVVELSPVPERQLAELLRLTAPGRGGG